MKERIEIMAAKNNALTKPVNLSPELEGVVGKGPMTRAQVTSKVWDHIKANKLQDSKDKRMINPDAKLGAVIGGSQISMFQMTAAVSKHLS
jgi:chromatin remodeling complex protein RSC6